MEERARFPGKELEERLWELDEDDPNALEEVYEKTVDSWRHGHVVEAVYVDQTGRYWKGRWRVQTNGDWNELEEGNVEFVEVFKTVKMVETTTYE